MDEGDEMTRVNVRYIVDDVDAAVAFYTEHLGFEVAMHPAPGFAALDRGSLRLLLNAPGAGGAGEAAPDGRVPAPGGWNRFQLEVEDLASVVERLRGRQPDRALRAARTAMIRSFVEMVERWRTGEVELAPITGLLGVRAIRGGDS